jgi:hypothetical protein
MAVRWPVGGDGRIRQTARVGWGQREYAGSCVKFREFALFFRIAAA